MGILNDLFPNIVFSDFVQALSSKNKKDFFLELQNLSCKGSERLSFDYEIIEKYSSKKEKANKFLDEALVKGRLASISFDGMVMDQYFVPGQKWRGSHGATIIGRKWNESRGICEYQIKNSWGSNWKQGGFTWLGEDELNAATRSVTYLECAHSSESMHVKLRN